MASNSLEGIRCSPLVVCVCVCVCLCLFVCCADNVCSYLFTFTLRETKKKKTERCTTSPLERVICHISPNKPHGASMRGISLEKRYMLLGFHQRSFLQNPLGFKEYILYIYYWKTIITRSRLENGSGKLAFWSRTEPIMLKHG